MSSSLSTLLLLLLAVAAAAVAAAAATATVSLSANRSVLWSLLVRRCFWLLWFGVDAAVLGQLLSGLTSLARAREQRSLTHRQVTTTSTLVLRNAVCCCYCQCREAARAQLAVLWYCPRRYHCCCEESGGCVCALVVAAHRRRTADERV